MTPTDREALAARITDYLASGGLFNPEFADHEAVRDLLIECRDALSMGAAGPVVQTAGEPTGPVPAAPTHYTAAQVRRVVNDLEAEAPSVRTITVLRAGRMLSAFADAITPPAQEGDKE